MEVIMIVILAIANIYLVTSVIRLNEINTELNKLFDEEFTDVLVVDENKQVGIDTHFNQSNKSDNDDFVWPPHDDIDA